MELARWHHGFERWLKENHQNDDTAHDISHFRRVWMTAQKIMVHHTAEPRVILTACYFHDIVSLPKNHPERSQSSRLARRARYCAATSRTFRPSILPPSRTRLRRTASAPALRRKV